MLRPYQVKCVKEVSDCYKLGLRSIILQMPTGAGKTRTASYIVGKYTQTNRQVLWLVHREELMLQSSMTFSEAEIDLEEDKFENILEQSLHLASLGYKHSLICSDKTFKAIKVRHAKEYGKCFIEPLTSKSLLIIASVPTLVRRLDKYPWLKPAQVIADECHLSLADTWHKVIYHFKESRILGLTATVERLDKKSFDIKQGGLYQAIVKGPSIKYLITDGSLSDYELYIPEVRFKETKPHKKGGDYDPNDLEEELLDPQVYGDVLKHYEERSKGKPAIAFCPTIKVADKFAEEFRKAGYKAISLNGDTEGDIRRDSLIKLGKGELDVIFSVNILIEGTDIPYATTAIWLRRTMSRVIWMQGNGRVFRRHPKKDKCIILDFVGNFFTHGYPDDDIEWSLSGKSRNITNSDMKKVLIKVCNRCGAVHKPAPVCPKCGYVYPPKGRKELKENKDGKLVNAKDVAITIQKKMARREQGMCKSYEDLLALAYKKGYQYPEYWAKKIYNSRKAKSLV